MAMDSTEFKALLETIKNNTAPAALDLTDKLDETQALALAESLKTNVSVHGLILRRYVSENKLGSKFATGLANNMKI